jgi:hypothetical protein
MPKNAEKCRKMPKNAEKRRKTPKNIIVNVMTINAVI